MSGPGRAIARPTAEGRGRARLCHRLSGGAGWLVCRLTKQCHTSQAGAPLGLCQICQRWGQTAPPWVAPPPACRCGGGHLAFGDGASCAVSVLQLTKSPRQPGVQMSGVVSLLKRFPKGVGLADLEGQS